LPSAEFGKRGETIHCKRSRQTKKRKEEILGPEKKICLGESEEVAIHAAAVKEKSLERAAAPCLQKKGKKEKGEEPFLGVPPASKTAAPFCLSENKKLSTTTRKKGDSRGEIGRGKK